MASDRAWYSRAAAAARRFWHTEDSRVAAVRDIVVAGGIVLLLLGTIWGYTGQPFPKQAPLVVVESGSMMHGPHSPCLTGNACPQAFKSPPFGRFGTIDPGDLVLVKRIDGFEEVETAFESGKRDGYGGHGDVLVYRRGGSESQTPVIHRALLFIRALPEGCLPNGASNPCQYQIPETCRSEFAQYVRAKPGQSTWKNYCQGSSEPITLDLERDGIFVSFTNYPCAASNTCAAFHSGIITKGDNNFQQDQTTPYQGEAARAGVIACCPVQSEWIVGKARGEIPWFGLIKLAIYGNARYGCGTNQPCSDPTRDAQWTILRATAPWDIWVGLFAAVGVLIAIPILTDWATGQIRRSRDRRDRPPL